MTRSTRVHELFFEALERPAGERSAWVAAQGLEPDERALLEDLLERDARRHGRTDVFDASALSEHLDHLGARSIVGALIGDCVVESLLGAGGMGLVFVASQITTHRRVALKLLRSDRLERGRARFEEEVELLARLNHPNIARVYGAGHYALTFAGALREVPYYTMEYVEGARTVVQFARERNLDLRARVALFIPICDAVHHGHQRGIVHRDLKPDNLLVSPDGTPKVIDFGIARSTQLARREVTVAGQLVGTLAYLSPEQVADARSTDARSDLYALGVVLYELLTDASPYRQAGTLPQLLHAIAAEPPVPSSRRDPRLAGDLEWILARALEKDPERRHPSVHALRGDLESFLERRPVSAGPPSALYRARRWTQRNPLAAAALLLASIGVVVGALGLSRGYLGALRSRGLAEERAAQRAMELERRDAAYRFLSDLLLIEGPETEPNVRVRDLLDHARERLGGVAERDAVLGAELYGAIGRSYQSLHMSESAEAALETSLRLMEAEFGADAPRTREARRTLALASRRFEELYGIAALSADAAAARAAGQRAEWLWCLSQALDQHLTASRRADALSTADMILAEAIQPGDDPALWARARRDRGHALALLGRREEAIVEMARAAQEFGELGHANEMDDAERARAVVLILLGRKSEAAAILEVSYAYHLANFGVESGSTAHVAVNLSVALAESNPKRAIELCEVVLAHVDEIGGDGRFARAAARSLATVYGRALADRPRAIELLQALWLREQALFGRGASHWDLAQTAARLGEFLYGEGRWSESVAARRLVVEHFAAVSPAGHPNRLRAQAELAHSLVEVASQAELVAELPALEAARDASREPSDRIMTSAALGRLLLALGRPVEAREVLAPLPGFAVESGTVLGPVELATLARAGIASDPPPVEAR